MVLTPISGTASHCQFISFLISPNHASTNPPMQSRKGELTAHQSPNTSHEIDQSALDAHITRRIAAAERGLRDCVGPSDYGSCQYVWERVGERV